MAGAERQLAPFVTAILASGYDNGPAAGPSQQQAEMRLMSKANLSPADRDRAAGLPGRSQKVKVAATLSLALTIYGMAGWIYVAICALVAPETLHLPLTHLVPFLREDTSGVLSFTLSFVCFVIYRLIRDS